MVRSNLRAHYRTKEEFDLEMDRIERSLELEEYLRDASIRIHEKRCLDAVRVEAG